MCLRKGKVVTGWLKLCREREKGGYEGTSSPGRQVGRVETLGFISRVMGRG